VGVKDVLGVDALTPVATATAAVGYVSLDPCIVWCTAPQKHAAIPLLPQGTCCWVTAVRRRQRPPA
jgi:hypothetical protein